MDRREDRELVGIGVVAESAVEIIGIASGLVSHIHIKTSSNMGLREAGLRENQIHTPRLIFIPCSA